MRKFTEEEKAKAELSEEDYKLSEEVIKPIYHNAVKNDFSFAKYGVECYHAGLKAGRPKWHKVADGDLPEEKKLYLVAIKENGLAISYFNGINWETKYNLGDFGHLVEKVIAWCEIPKYTEE